MPVLEGERNKLAAGRRRRPTRRRPMAVAATQRALRSRRSARLCLAGAPGPVAMMAVRGRPPPDRTGAPESATMLEARSATEEQGDAAPQLGVGLAGEAP